MLLMDAMGAVFKSRMVSSGALGSTEDTKVPKPELPQPLKEVPAASGGFLNSPQPLLNRPGWGLYFITTRRLSLESQASERGSQGKSASRRRDWLAADHL